MTAHTHTTIVEGCFRCELSRDEMAMIEAENNKVLADVMRRLIESEKAVTQAIHPYGELKGNHFYVEGRVEVTSTEFDILTEIMDFE